MAEKGKKTWLAYLLLVFLGGVGAHQFYLGKIKRGIIFPVIVAAAYLTLRFSFLHPLEILLTNIKLGNVVITLSMGLWIAYLILWLIDIFTLPRQIRKLSE